MTDFEKWDDRYKKKWCTVEQLQELVQLQVLTEVEYETIIDGNYIPVENEGLGERMEELEQTVDILIGENN